MNYVKISIEVNKNNKDLVTNLLNEIKTKIVPTSSLPGRNIQKTRESILQKIFTRLSFSHVEEINSYTFTR